MKPSLPGAHRLGASWQAGVAAPVQFVVWCPRAASVKLHLLTPSDRLVRMEREADAYFSATLADLPDGSKYRYRITYASGERRERPDPASRSQMSTASSM